MRAHQHFIALALLLPAFSVTACGDDDDDEELSPAQRYGVGTACDSDDDCVFDEDYDLQCLSFKGGYCGLEGCSGDDECPPGSACVAHDDGSNYCFLICVDKVDCNDTRPADAEANCSSNIDFLDEQNGVKACVPPS